MFTQVCKLICVGYITYGYRLKKNFVVKYTRFFRNLTNKSFISSDNIPFWKTYFCDIDT